MKNLIISLIFAISTLGFRGLTYGQALPIVHSLFTTNAAPVTSSDGQATQVGDGGQASSLSVEVGRNANAQFNAVAVGDGAIGWNGSVSIGKLAFTPQFSQPNNNVLIGNSPIITGAYTNIVDIGGNQASPGTQLQLNTDNTFNWGGVPLFVKSGNSIMHTGNGGGLTNLPININVVTNTQPNVILNPLFSTISQAPVLTFGTTNPFYAYGMVFAPWYNGKYSWVPSLMAYTNSVMLGSSNVCYRFNSNLGEWEYTTNLADVSGNKIQTYTYIGANDFPTNDPYNWLFGLPNGNTEAGVVFMGQTNGVINLITNSQITGFGEEIHNSFATPDGGANPALASWNDFYQMQFNRGPNFSFCIDSPRYLGQALTNPVSAVFDINGHLGSGAYDNVCTMQYCIDGSRRNIRRVKGITVSGQPATYITDEELNLLPGLPGVLDYYAKDEYCHQMFGNLTPLHQINDGGLGLHPAAWCTFYGGGSNGVANAYATIWIAPTNLPTPILNGGINADGTNIYVDESGVRGVILQGQGSPLNGSSLTNVNPAALSAYTSTNTLVVTGTGLTNATSDTYLISTTAGAGMVLKDANGNQFASPPATATFPLKPGWRLSGTAITGMALIQSK